MVKAIVFDLGGVILTHNLDIITSILSEIFSMPKDEWNEAWDKNKLKLYKGELSIRDFLNQLRLKYKTSYALEEIYLKHAEIDQKVLNLVVRLKSRYRVYLN